MRRGLSNTRPAAVWGLAGALLLGSWSWVGGAPLFREPVPISTWPAEGLPPVSARPPRPVPGERTQPRQADPRVALGLVSAQVSRGGALFFGETFGGNGRTCASCHPVENDTTIDPGFIAKLREETPGAPLFASDLGRQLGVPGLEIPDLLESHGLVRENVDGFASPSTHFVLRGVPHLLSLATSIDPPPAGPGGQLPDGTSERFEHRLGWSGDGAGEPGTLRRFVVGAVAQHLTRNAETHTPGRESFRHPSAEQLAELEAFLLSLGRTRDLSLADVRLHNLSAERGRTLFSTGRGGAKCFVCHADAGARSTFGGNRNFDTGIERVRLALLDPRGIPGDGGFGGASSLRSTLRVNKGLQTS